jgi:hypothetical protein
MKRDQSGCNSDPNNIHTVCWQIKRFMNHIVG